MPEIVSLASLARKLGLSERRARDHAAAGAFVKAGRGYDLEASRFGYMAALRRSATGRRGEGRSTANEERGRLARLQGDALELRNKQARKELIPEAEIEAAWLEIVHLTRAAVLAAASRIHADLPHLTAFDVATIDRHLRGSLTRLAAGP